MVELPAGTRFGSKGLRNPALLGILVAGLAVPVVYFGGVGLLATMTALFWIVAIAYRWPLVIAGLALLQSGDFLKFLPADAFLTLRIGPGLGLNLLDILVAVSLPFALTRLARRHERPVFTWPVLLLMGMAAVSISAGLIVGGSLDAALGLSRGIFYYSMYFVLVAAIDSRRKLNGWIRFILGIVVVACVLQLVEALMGHRFGAGLDDAYMFGFGSGGRISVGENVSVLYLWNRAAMLSLLGLMLGLGVIVETRPVRLRYVWLSGMITVSFALAFVRQWFIYVVAGVIGVLVAQRTGRARGVVATALVAGLVVSVLFAGSPLLRASFGPSFLDAWLARATTIASLGGQGNHIGRVQMMQFQWDSFVMSPIVGHGYAAAPLNAAGATSSDVGITNTLVETGLLGLLAVAVLWVTFLVNALRVRGSTDEDEWRGYAIGLIGFWTAVLAGALYGVNYFSVREGVFVIVVAMALLDRLGALRAPAKEAAPAQKRSR